MCIWTITMIEAIEKEVRINHFLFLIKAFTEYLQLLSRFALGLRPQSLNALVCAAKPARLLWRAHRGNTGINYFIYKGLEVRRSAHTAVHPVLVNPRWFIERVSPVETGLSSP